MIHYCLLHKSYLKNNQIYSKCTKGQRTKNGNSDSYGKLLYLIEYDGIQHFDKNHQFGNKEETLKNIQERDKIKNNYCLEHKIPLIRIPYTYLSKINIIDLKLETSSFVERGD